MTYSFTTRPGQGARALIPTRYNLSGYTLSVEYDDNSNFNSLVTGYGTVTYANNRITLELSASDVDTLQDTFFRIKAVGDLNFYVTDGYIDYVPLTSEEITSDLIDSNGYIKNSYLPPVNTAIFDENVSAVVEDTNSNTSAALRAAYGSRLTYDKVAKPALVQHQGTNLILPDHTSLAYRTGWARGLRILDMDCQALSDGVLANNHDGTVNATVNGQTGNVSSFSSLQWLQFTRNVASWPGLPANLPMTTIADHIREYGPAAVYAIEPKAEGLTDVQAVVDLVTALGVAEQTIIQCTNLANLAPAVTAGITAQHITDSPDAAALSAAGVELVCMSLNAGVPAIQAAVAAGLRVWVWDVNRQYDYAQAAAAGAEAVIANDAAYVAGARGDLRYKRTTDPFASGMWYPGMQMSANSRGGFIAPNRWGFTTGGNGWVLQGYLGPLNSPSGSLTFNVTFDAAGVSGSTYAGVFLGLDDRPYKDNIASAGYLNGYRFYLQSNGSIKVDRLDAAGNVVTNIISYPSTAGGQMPDGTTATLVVSWTATTVSIARTDAGSTNTAVHSANDSTYRGSGFWPTLGQASLGGAQKASFSAVTAA